MFIKKDKPTKFLFATDIHGSEKCWQKLVNSGAFFEVDSIVLGGDMTGKGVQAIMEIKLGKWQTNFLGETVEASGEEELIRLEQRVRSAGFYPRRMSPDAFAEFANSAEVQDRVFEESMAATIQGWLEFAERKLKGTGRRIIVTAGNDDPLFINELFTGCSVVVMAERQVLQFDEHHEMINEGYSNPTPWHTHREMDEESLYKVIEAQAEQVKDMKNAIFNLHVPPYNSKLDDAPLLDKNLVPIDGGRTYGPVGSKAVRKAIEKYQPLLGLHGHVHEAKGQANIGRTLCLNPGSTYTEGVLSGYLITLGKDGVRGFQPIQG
ncbi:MAG: metallophosphoesterase family protein [Anaerolineales bacterium]